MSSSDVQWFEELRRNLACYVQSSFIRKGRSPESDKVGSKKVEDFQ